MSILRDNRNRGPRDLRDQLSRGFVTAAGVFNGISGLLAERAGFTASYLSGSGVAASMGLPDLSLTTLTEVAEETARITAVTGNPLIVDVDTGFGETLNVERTVKLMERAGAAAIHVEDQDLPKKCGHLNGKKIIDDLEMARKIKAAVSTRSGEMVIIARTDSRAVYGLDDAIRRANLYLEYGADMIFTEALESKEEFEKFARSVKGHLLANMTEFGKSPYLTVSELKEIGYSAVIFPLTAFRAALKTMNGVYEHLYRDGTQAGFTDSLMTRKEFYTLIGYDTYEIEDRDIFEVKNG